MRITERPSPNFNDRRAGIDMLVLHYTGMESAAAALRRLGDPAASVSAHYVVCEDGQVIRLVDEAARAWHAGVARWQGDADLNSRSIGIEIVNGGHDVPLQGGRLPPYPQAQVEAVIALARDIIARHAIAQTRIVGHSDIAPARKRDPGEHFPWARLAAAGIGLWPDEVPAEPEQGWPPVIGRGLGPGDAGAAVARVRALLSAIGYAAGEGAAWDADLAMALTAFQRRWHPERVSGLAGHDTLMRLAAVAALYRAGSG